MAHNRENAERGGNAGRLESGDNRRQVSLSAVVGIAGAIPTIPIAPAPGLTLYRASQRKGLKCMSA
jgi:hypothetical protein